MAKRIFSGITPKAKGDSYVEPPQGVRFIRSGEITPDGGVLAQSEVHISESIHTGLMRRSQIQKGDLLIAIVGATIGSSGIYESDRPANINQAIAAVRLGDPHVLVDYARWYILSSLGQSILDFLKRPVARANINLEEIGDIPLIIPPLPVQREMVGEMERARQSRRRKLEQADALLSGLDTFLLECLGLTLPESDNRLAYAVRLGLKDNERIDPHFHHPNFRHLLAEIQRKPNKPLGDIVGLSKEQRDPASHSGETFRYIEISGVNRYTGEITANETPISEAPSRARMLVSEGDIIVSLTRPHHGSIGYIDTEYDQCIASTGFAVIHEYKDPALLPQYLLAVLRSSFSLQQMLQRSSGGNYPAITEEELKRILIPIPDESTQREIVEELHERHMNARRLREEAAREWDAAKARFEAKLLGTEKIT